MEAATAALPNEAFGFICRTPGVRDAYLVLLPGTGSPVHFDADPGAVVDFAYRVVDRNATIVATFHSHPTGARHWSSRDTRFLTAWAKRHVLAVRKSSHLWVYAVISNRPQTQSSTILK